MEYTSYVAQHFKPNLLNTLYIGKSKPFLGLLEQILAVKKETRIRKKSLNFNKAPGQFLSNVDDAALAWWYNNRE